MVVKKININTKKLKFRAGNTIVTVVTIVCVILLNIIVALVEPKVPDLKIDLTRDSLTMLTDETKTVLKALDETDKKINVIQLVGDSEPEANVRDVLLQYDSMSQNITYTVENYVKKPSVLKGYDIDASYANNAVLVSNEDKSRMRVITLYDMWPDAALYMQQGLSYDHGQFMLESRMTNAIGYVMSDRVAKVCVSTGHNEANPSVLAYALNEENINVTQLDLSTGNIPDGTDLFMIMGPQTDFTQIEVDAIDTYLNKGGSVAVGFAGGTKLETLESYLKDWGVEFRQDIVLEKDASLSYQQSGTHFYPQIQQSAVTAGIDKKIFAAWAGSMSLTETGDISAAPIMTTSPDAYSVLIEEQNIDTDAMTAGQYTIGCILEKPIGGSFDNTAKLIVTTTPSVWGLASNMITELDQYAYASLNVPSFGNRDFLMNTVSYAAGFENVSVAVPNKEVSISILDMPIGMRSLCSTVLCILLPLAVLAAGIVVWIKRRHL